MKIITLELLGDFLVKCKEIFATQTGLANHIEDTENPHSITKEQIELGNVVNVLQYSSDNPPPYPVTSVNGKTGAVVLSSESWTFTLEDDTTVTKEVVVK